MKALCLFPFALALVSTPAAADTCKVRVVRAPDEVRPVIEAWVRAEPNCRHDLEVRVIATQDGGYYLYARDAAGRIRERTVPDAVAVGVLVASWIADDAAPVVQIVPVTPALAPTPRMESTVPGAPRVRPSGFSFTLGGITSPAKAYGIRAEVELLSRSGLSVYGAASIGRTRLAFQQDGFGPLELYPTDKRVTAGVGYGWHGQRWGARVRLGVTHVTWTGDFGAEMADTTFDGVETGLRVTRTINPRWSITGGLDVSRYLNQSTHADSISVIGPALDIGLLAGATARL